ncbi:SAM domain-containing protein SAMSN-1b [Lampris incognitus]|uniref:SAM domain-containing protein SAMSN-1b n=1 Tax=Lampris incognitus TaxID=2546036 RepID=UPI0024B53E9A|nr:SAM domain-containing protein SAMSN-1b [Lampris incognitus]
MPGKREVGSGVKGAVFIPRMDEHEGSTDSIYEATPNKTTQGAIPKYQCSPALLRCKPEWGGSDPCINSSNESEVETTGSPGKRKKFHWLGQVCSIRLTQIVSASSEHVADVAPRDDRPVINCIGLGKRTTKKSTKTASSPWQGHSKGAEKDKEEEELWRPEDNSHQWIPAYPSQPWPPSYHTCHQLRHEPWIYGFDFTLPRTTEWDHFESLLEELDAKKLELSPSRVVRSITDQGISESGRSTRPGRFDAFKNNSPLMKQQYNGNSLDKQAEDSNATKPIGLGKKMKVISQNMCKRATRKHVKAQPEELSKDPEEDRVDEGDFVGERPFAKGYRHSATSLESLYSLNSAQSSSSGVTSGSDCSSNRASLRLEGDLPNMRRFCCRARVHTDFVPSPYDTESLKLKAGDMINIISKPPMGIWTGMLNGKVGNFKFIYVDVLEEKTNGNTQTYGWSHESRPKTLQELLKRFSLEEYVSSLQLNGYQTVDDLMGLRERHLTELKVTDPEHRRRLLAAVESLQEAQPDCQWGSGPNPEPELSEESFKADTNNCPRDSGCHMFSDGSDNSKEDTEIHIQSVSPPLTEITTT